MGEKVKVYETGAILGRHQSWRGEMISVAITFSETEWLVLTRSFAALWEEVEEDFNVRELTIDQRIALLVIGQADHWSQQVDPDCLDDLDEDAPL